MTPRLSLSIGRSLALPAAAVVLALLASACSRDVYLTDDIDVDLDLSATGPSDSLHQPYVLGTPVTISAFPSEDAEDTSGWWIVSSNPDVVHIQTQQGGSAKCLAAGVGQSTLSVYASVDDGEPLRSVQVDVRTPDRAELFAHGPMIVRQGDDAARVQTPSIVTGGRATFLVRYFEGGTRLYGNRVLGLKPSAGLGAEADSTFLFENQDWVRLSPQVEGAHSLRLFAAGIDLGAIRVDGVSPGKVRSLALVGEPDDDARDGQTLAVMAQAYGDDGRRVFGAAFSWQLGDVHQSGFGDLFRYTYDARSARPLSAAAGANTAAATVHAADGYVADSVAAGCNMTPHVPDDAWILAVSGLATLLALRRRTG